MNDGETEGKRGELIEIPIADVRIQMNPGWTRIVPEDPGLYWFVKYPQEPVWWFSLAEVTESLTFIGSVPLPSNHSGVFWPVMMSPPASRRIDLPPGPPSDSHD